MSLAADELVPWFGIVLSRLALLPSIQDGVLQIWTKMTSLGPVLKVIPVTSKLVQGITIIVIERYLVFCEKRELRVSQRQRPRHLSRGKLPPGFANLVGVIVPWLADASWAVRRGAVGVERYTSMLDSLAL